MSTVYLALGSNLGDRGDNLRRAVAALASEIRVTAGSPIYETPAWGYEAQPAFLNMVLEAETSLPPESLLAHVKRLETELGRTPSFHWGPRLIDIDILFYDDRVLNTPQLIIPHPRLHERAFVLVPLNDLAPRLVHPVLGRTIAEFLASMDTSGIARWDNAPQDARPSPSRVNRLDIMAAEAAMAEIEIKPLNWKPKPGIGMEVERRPDGGMTLTFSDMSDATLKEWHDFALDHLLGMQGRTRNLYDLRRVRQINEKAVRTAVEVNSDPSARNIRLAVVVASPEAAESIRKIAALALPETAAGMKIFTDLDEADAWLSRSLDEMP